jgi:transcriptional regulator with XRE-family HTH domain
MEREFESEARARRINDLLQVAAGGNRRELARITGVDDGTIRNMLKGKHRPDLQTLDRMQAALGLSHAVLLGREPIPEEFFSRFAYSHARRQKRGGDDEVKNSQLMLQTAKDMRGLLKALLEKHDDLIAALTQETKRESRDLGLAPKDDDERPNGSNRRRA